MLSPKLERIRLRRPTWTLIDTYCFIARFLRSYHTDPSGTSSELKLPSSQSLSDQSHVPPGPNPPLLPREFHDYFVTHLPSSSLSHERTPVYKQFPRSASVPHNADPRQSSHAALQAVPAVNPRDTTVVRIPLRRAKHHFGAAISRGNRPINEDNYQAGVIDVPAFAKRSPKSLSLAERKAASENRVTVADTANGDPQVFYYGVYDGHGGVLCSEFLRERLHEYIQDTAAVFGLRSSLHDPKQPRVVTRRSTLSKAEKLNPAFLSGEKPLVQQADRKKIGVLETDLVQAYQQLIGGYYRRFKPEHFAYHAEEASSRALPNEPRLLEGASMEEVVEYAFLKADYDFVSDQAKKQDEDDLVQSDQPLNANDIWSCPSRLRVMEQDGKRHIGGPKRFKGGSTASIAMLSTPSAMPYWHPSSVSTLLVAHVGDTRVLLCGTATGSAIPLTINHHPSSPVEANRLRRFSHTFMTDSFGEERIIGLANTRSFGDISAKRLGVSSEPQISRVDIGPAEYSFLVLVSDGVSDALMDQEICDIIKESKTPEQGARDIVDFATMCSPSGDNATCLVVRLGGWERRLEGGVGSMGTKESRQWKRDEANNPRGNR